MVLTYDKVVYNYDNDQANREINNNNYYTELY